MNKRRLVELCDIIVPMRDKPKVFVSEENGVPWCRIEDVEGKFLNNSISQKYVSKECIVQMNLKVFPVGTVLCAVTGASIGTYAITTRELITNQTFAGLVCKENLLYNEFLYYYIKMHTGTFVNNSVGCAQAYITRETLENFPIPDLKYDEQVQLVKVLKYLDDKININNKINAELESMARTIYDYWFLQFDFPDENGKPYKSSGGKMVWKEELKREIPEGWESDEIGNLMESKRGISYNSATIGAEGVPMINLASFNTNGTYKPSGIKTYSGVYEQDKVLKPYDLLMCNTQQTAIDFKKDIIGKAILIPDIFEGDIVSSHHVTAIKTHTDEMKYYLYYLFNTEFFHKYIAGYTNGTNILGLLFEGVEKYKVTIPSKNVIKKYANIAKDIEKQKCKIIKENQELASLRDFLLPLLMNGQVGFKEC